VPFAGIKGGEKKNLSKGRRERKEEGRDTAALPILSSSITTTCVNLRAKGQSRGEKGGGKVHTCRGGGRGREASPESGTDIKSIHYLAARPSCLGALSSKKKKKLDLQGRGEKEKEPAHSGSTVIHH